MQVVEYAPSVEIAPIDSLSFNALRWMVLAKYGSSKPEAITVSKIMTAIFRLLQISRSMHVASYCNKSDINEREKKRTDDSGREYSTKWGCQVKKNCISCVVPCLFVPVDIGIWWRFINLCDGFSYLTMLAWFDSRHSD